MRGVDRRFRDMMGKRGKRYAAFLLFSAGVLSTAGFAQRTELFYPSRADEVIVLETLGQAQDVLLEGNLSGPAACRQLLASSGTVTEAGESVAAKEVFAAAKEAANVGEGVEYSDSTLKLLASIIFCEAGNQPYEGQVAVGAVVINRVLSSVYPNTVSGVIYQYKQFAPVLDGHLALALAENRATESCYRAADEAMSGYTNVGQCVYFRTPIPGLSGIQIGDHIFY